MDDCDFKEGFFEPTTLSASERLLFDFVDSGGLSVAAMKTLSLEDTRVGLLLDASGFLSVTVLLLLWVLAVGFRFAVLLLVSVDLDESL
jgi:hypothetical protein